MPTLILPRTSAFAREFGSEPDPVLLGIRRDVRDLLGEVLACVIASATVVAPKSAASRSLLGELDTCAASIDTLDAELVALAFNVRGRKGTRTLIARIMDSIPTRTSLPAEDLIAPGAAPFRRMAMVVAKTAGRIAEQLLAAAPKPTDYGNTESWPEVEQQHMARIDMVQRVGLYFLGVADPVVMVPQMREQVSA